MALRKPLVLNSGTIEQLQAGDTLDAVVSEVDVIAMTNNSGATINICHAVYCGGANQANAAVASAIASSRVIGFAKETIADANTGNFQTSGVMNATTGQWDAVTGGTGGLTAGSPYYLSDAASGNITTTAPSASGNYLTFVGYAVSTTDLMINPDRPVKL